MPRAESRAESWSFSRRMKAGTGLDEKPERQAPCAAALAELRTPTVATYPAKRPDDAAGQAADGAGDGPGGRAGDPALPRFLQLRALLADRIAGGEWRPGESLPTQRQLAAAYGVSINTVCRALAPFVDAGVLQQKQGAGTFLRRMPPLQSDGGEAGVPAGSQ